MSDATAKTYPPSADMAARAHVDAQTYDKMYQASVTDTDGFWREQAQRIDWIKPFTQVRDVNFDLGSVSINWFADGELNVSANCIDRSVCNFIGRVRNRTESVWQRSLSQMVLDLIEK